MLGRFIAIFFGSLVVASCGGGGGGGGPTSVYTGATTQATVSGGNAANLTTSSYSIVDTSNSFTSSVTGNLKPGLGAPGFLAHPIAKAVEALGEGPRYATAAGTCGGTMTATAGGTSPAKSVTLTYANYCFFGVTMNGTISGSGSPGSYSITFTSFTASYSGVTVSVAGTVVATASVSGTVATADSTINLQMSYSGTSSHSIKSEDLVVHGTVDSSTLGYTTSISGKFYYSSSGYVTLSTPVVISGTGSSLPSAGQIRADGAGNTAARATLSSGGAYTVEYSLNNGTTWTTAGTGTLGS